MKIMEIPKFEPPSPLDFSTEEGCNVANDLDLILSSQLDGQSHLSKDYSAQDFNSLLEEVECLDTPSTDQNNSTFNEE